MNRSALKARGRQTLANTFRSLRIRNFRLYVTGQLVSVTGLGMQTIGQAWLVVERTDSGLALGLTLALQFLPILLFGSWGGLLADRLDKHRLLQTTQVVAAAIALVLWGLVAAGLIELWMIYALAFAFGCVHALDMPARHSFVIDMVGPTEVPNAVALNSAVFHTGRLIGSALAGLVIYWSGVAFCFLANALTYAASFAALRAMNRSELVLQPRATRGRGQVREGLRYAWSTPGVRSTLALVAVIGTFGVNFVVILPLLVREDLGGGARLLGALTAAMGVGSLLGALFAAARSQPTRRWLVGAAGTFGLITALVAFAPNPILAVPLLVGAGLGMMAFMATANATLQLEAAPAMRGRVMALYGLLFLGSTPIGGPLMGYVADRMGARAALAMAGIACLAAAAVAARRAPPVAALPSPPVTPVDPMVDDTLGAA